MKPIIFNTDTVRAILEDRKMVTRRVVKPQPPNAHMILDYDEEENSFDFLCGAISDGRCIDFAYTAKAPYQPGDILYVRETWAKMECSECSVDEDDCESSVERNGLTIFCNGNMYVYKATDLLPGGYKWRPSIYMPREAARIFLRVTDVRAERLRDIFDDPPGPENQIVKEGYRYGFDFNAAWNRSIKPADRALYGWEANPYVWAIAFERCEKPEGD